MEIANILNILSWILLWIVIVLNNKMINNQQKQLNKYQQMMSNVLKVSKDYSDFVDKHYNNIVRNTLSKEIEMQTIIESAKETKENFSETLEKIEKVLYEK